MFDIHRVELDWGGRKLVLETGKIARQADGAVVASYGESKVLATVVAAKEPKTGIDFLQLLREDLCSRANSRRLFQA
jgi:polyribonucleotide nucleotidyltransferase